MDLDVSSAGRATVAWRSELGKIFATRVTAGGRVGRGPQELSTSKSPDARSPEVTVTRGGSIVAWTSQPGSHYRVERSGLTRTGKALGTTTVAVNARGPELIAGGLAAATIGYVGVERGASIAGVRLGEPTGAAQTVFEGETMGLQLARDGLGSVTAAATVRTPEGEYVIEVAQAAP